MSLFSKIGHAFSSAAHAVGHAASEAAHGVESAAKAVGHAVESGAKAVEHGAEDAFHVIKGGAETAIHGIETAAVAVEHGVEKAAVAVEHGIETAAKETGGFLKSAGKYIGGELKAFGEGVWNSVLDIGGGLVGAAEDIGKGLVGGIGGFVSNLVKGNVGDAFESLIQGADRIIFQAPGRIFNGVVDGANDLVDGASHLLGPLGKPIRSVADRAFDIARTAGNTVLELGRDAARLLPETALTFGRGIVKSAGDLIHGNFKQAAKDFGMSFVDAGARALGGVGDMVMRSLQGVASIALTATYLQPPSRKLTDDEKNLLREVYGNSVDVDAIRISEGGPLNNAMAPHTVGNTIYMPKNSTGALFDSSGNFTAAGSLLVHETGHVWQSQNAGGDYIAQSLWNQGVAEAQGKSRNEAYDFRSAIRDGKSFDQLNPEEQAEYIQEVLGPILAQPGSAEDNLAASGLAGADLDFAKQALNDIRNGVGAA
jgi:hypothetical protein